jgi:hypothetical protein
MLRCCRYGAGDSYGTPDANSIIRVPPRAGIDFENTGHHRRPPAMPTQSIPGALDIFYGDDHVKQLRLPEQAAGRDVRERRAHPDPVELAST